MQRWSADVKILAPLRRPRGRELALADYQIERIEITPLRFIML